jgi:hypothetical protein
MNNDQRRGLSLTTVHCPLTGTPLPPYFIFKTLQVIKRLTVNVIAFQDWSRSLTGHANPENAQAHYTRVTIENLGAGKHL